MPKAALFCSLVVLLSCGLGHAADAKALTIAVIPKGTTHEFWKSIHAGAVKAAREFGAAGQPVKIIWKGPLKEDDRAQQIDVVQGFVTQGVSAIVLAPLDSKALAQPVEQAVDQGIPVVVIDSGLESQKQASFVATNNFAGGQLAGECLGAALAGSGRIALLRYQVGSASTEQREAGFLDAMKKFPKIEIISSDQYTGATRETALTASQNLLNRYKDKLTGVFTPNESSTAGMALALKEVGLTGGPAGEPRRIAHVGFDASEPLIAALAAGDIRGLVVQDPFQMGYLGVKNAVAAATGRTVDKQVDTPLQLVTPENLAQPAIQALIKPPLDQYLDGK
ncbi:MAG: substrate-binding domain-containing protein [Planctomycetes bacterium]|nr:substrate-binding domain-containing protein [Planctomycetota bacterium]